MSYFLSDISTLIQIDGLIIHVSTIVPNLTKGLIDINRCLSNRLLS